jgi:hypothetical protein
MNQLKEDKIYASIPVNVCVTKEDTAVTTNERALFASPGKKREREPIHVGPCTDASRQLY